MASPEQYTHEDFLRGNVESIMNAENPDILAMWQHGEERLGADLGYYLNTERPDILQRMDYLCGNPLAAAAGRRYTKDGSDMNRSWNPKGEPETYEEVRAEEIRQLIEGSKYKYVLDLHTTRSNSDRFFLIGGRNEAVDRVIAASPITRIAVMPEFIAKGALIGQIPQGVSLEYHRPVAKERGVEECVAIIDRLLGNEPFAEPLEREFFHVTGHIPREEDPGPDLPNFEWYEEGGYYPVLLSSSEGGYRSNPNNKYVGFAATKRSVVLL